MKKILSLCLTSVLIFTVFVSCGKSTVVGSWTTTVTAVSSMEVTYTFNNDGTGSFSASNVSENFTYEATDTELSITTSLTDENGNVAPSTITYSYEISKNTLTLVTDDSEVVFKREK